MAHKREARLQAEKDIKEYLKSMNKCYIKSYISIAMYNLLFHLLDS